MGGAKGQAPSGALVQQAAAHIAIALLLCIRLSSSAARAVRHSPRCAIAAIAAASSFAAVGGTASVQGASSSSVMGAVLVAAAAAADACTMAIDYAATVAAAAAQPRGCLTPANAV